MALVGTSVLATWPGSGVIALGTMRIGKNRIPASTHDPEISARSHHLHHAIGRIQRVRRAGHRDMECPMQERGLCGNALVQARTRQQDNLRDILVREWTLDERRAS